MKYKMIPMIDAGDLPMEIIDWCVSQEIPTHYDSGITVFESGADNPLMNFLREQGFKTDEKYTYVAVHGT